MATPRHDWYFNDWLAYAQKSQAAVAEDLEWNKAKVSLFVSGKQRYHRDDVNELAAYLHLEPFELLLPPHRAMALRQLRASAEEIVKEVPPPDPVDEFSKVRVDRQDKPKPKRRTGTHG